MVVVAAIGFLWTTVAAFRTEREIAYQQARERCQGATNSECQQLATAVRQAVAGERSADFAAMQLWLSLIGLIGVGATVVFAAFAWHEAQRSADVAHKDFIATHRPRVRVRFIQENSEGTDDRRVALITIANVGDTEAIVTGIGGDIGLRWKRNKKWMAPGIKGSASGHAPPPRNIIKGGEQRTYSMRSAAPLPFAGVPELMRDVDLMASGEIIYKDGNGVIRRTGFLWRWDESTLDWVPTDEPLNYED